MFSFDGEEGLKNLEKTNAFGELFNINMKQEFDVIQDDNVTAWIEEAPICIIEYTGLLKGESKLDQTKRMELFETYDGDIEPLVLYLRGLDEANKFENKYALIYRIYNDIKSVEPLIRNAREKLKTAATQEHTLASSTEEKTPDIDTVNVLSGITAGKKKEVLDMADSKLDKLIESSNASKPKLSEEAKNERNKVIEGLGQSKEDRLAWTGSHFVKQLIVAKPSIADREVQGAKVYLTKEREHDKAIAEYKKLTDTFNKVTGYRPDYQGEDLAEKYPNIKNVPTPKKESPTFYLEKADAIRKFLNSVNAEGKNIEDFEVEHKPLSKTSAVKGYVVTDGKNDVQYDVAGFALALLAHSSGAVYGYGTVQNGEITDESVEFRPRVYSAKAKAGKVGAAKTGQAAEQKKAKDSLLISASRVAKFRANPSNVRVIYAAAGSQSKNYYKSVALVTDYTGTNKTEASFKYQKEGTKKDPATGQKTTALLTKTFKIPAFVTVKSIEATANSEVDDAIVATVKAPGSGQKSSKASKVNYMKNVEVISGSATAEKLLSAISSTLTKGVHAPADITKMFESLKSSSDAAAAASAAAAVNADASDVAI